MMLHELYEDTDENIPEAILARNGEVVFALCKKCGAVEQELLDFPTCDQYEKYLENDIVEAYLND